jgi:serine/threonine protein kinase
LVLSVLVEHYEAANKFDPENAAETAEMPGDVSGHGLMMDVAELGEKLVDAQDFERIGGGREQSGGRMFPVKRLEDDAEFWMKIIATHEGKHYMQEIEVMATVKHPAALSLVGWQPAGQDTEAVIVTDLCQRETLADVLTAERNKRAPAWWNATVKSKVIVGIACAVAEMHKHGFMHRELGPDAVFFDKDFNPRIGEFDCVRIDKDLSSAAAHRAIWTYAPETFEGGNCTRLVDVYAYGMTLYAIFREPNYFEDAPTTAVTPDQAITNLRQGKRFARHESIPHFHWEIITACWKHLPGQRPQFAYIVEKLRTSHQAYALPGTDMDELRRYEEAVFPAGDLSASLMAYEWAPAQGAPKPPPVASPPAAPKPKPVVHPESRPEPTPEPGHDPEATSAKCGHRKTVEDSVAGCCLLL